MKASDILYIEQLTVIASVGINDWERQCLQKLVFNIQLTCMDVHFARNSTVSSYLDYTQINEIILDLVSKNHFLLIENVAEKTATTLMEKLEMISWIRITVNKPNAIYNADGVGICIERQRVIE